MASWLNASGKNGVVLLRGPITEHLIGAYEIWAVYYSMAAWAQQLPRGGVVNKVLTTVPLS